MLGRELGNREVLAACLGGLARRLSVQGRTHQALQLVGAVQACYQSQSLPTPPEVQDDVSPALTAARTTLDEAEEESILAVGRALGLDQAIALGLERGRSSKSAVAVAACAPPAGSGPQALRPTRHGRYLRPSRTN
jgi:hypothetical protein